MSKSYIAAGEWITCENGHRYAKALADIGRGEVIKGENFEKADGTLPRAGERIGPCECGAGRMYRSPETLGFIPFVEGRGWLRRNSRK